MVKDPLKPRRVLFVGHAYEGGDTRRGIDPVWGMLESSLKTRSDVQLSMFALEPFSTLPDRFPGQLFSKVAAVDPEVVFVRASLGTSSLLAPLLWREILRDVPLLIVGTSDVADWLPVADAVLHLLGTPWAIPKGDTVRHLVGYPPIDPAPFVGWNLSRTWDVVLPPVDAVLRSFVDGLAMGPEAQVLIGCDADPDVFRRSRAVVNFATILDGRPRILPRVFAAMHAGAAVFEQDNTVSRDLFGPYDCVEFFTTPDDLSARLHAFRSDPNALRARQQAARKFLGDHTPAALWDQVLALFDERSRSTRSGCLPSVSELAAAESRTYSWRCAARAPVRDAGHIALIVPDPPSRAAYDAFMESVRATAADPSRITAIIAVHADSPDAEAWKRRFLRAPVEVRTVAVEGSSSHGERVNQLRLVNLDLGSGVYLALPPHAQLLTRHWDAWLRRFGTLFGDTLWFAEFRDVGRVPDFVWGAVGADLANLLGGIYPEVLPGELAERWLLDVARRSSRSFPSPIEARSAPYEGCFNPGFWNAAYEALVPDRWLETSAAIGTLSEGVPALRAAIEQRALRWIEPPLAEVRRSGSRPNGWGEAEARVAGRLHEISQLSAEDLGRCERAQNRSVAAGESLYQRVAQAVAAGDWAEALPAVAQYMRDFPGFPRPFRLAADALEKSGDVRAAKRVRRLGARLFPEDALLVAST